jgi:hypothetical protein
MKPSPRDDSMPTQKQLKMLSMAVAAMERRTFLKRSLLGSLAFASLASVSRVPSAHAGEKPPHFPPKAKRVIYLFQSGGPSQLELMDYKPKLKELHGTELPESIRQGQRLTGMT